VLLNPFCPLTTAKVLTLKATVLLLLALLRGELIDPMDHALEHTPTTH
jgi:hypothetical protein